MKIAILHMGFFYSGGGERTVINEALGLRKRGHAVDVYAPIIRPNESFPELIGKVSPRSYLPSTHLNIPLRDGVSILASSLLSPFFASRFKKYDALLCHGQPSSWIGYVISKELGKPYAAYLHSPTRFIHPRPVDLETSWKVNPSFRMLDLVASKLCNAPAKAFDTASVAGANRLLANSRWSAEKISRIYGVKPEICYPGVGLTYYHELMHDENLPLKPQNGHDFILSTSRHYPQKRLEWLIQAASLLRKDLREHKLIFTGRATTYTTQLRRLAEGSGVSDSVIFLGEVGEGALTKLYRKAGVCAFPAPDEDFGLGPLEAGLCRTPSVVWDYAGHAETVLQSETGYRATPYLIEDFADKMVSVLADDSLRNRMGSNAYDFAASNFSWEKHNDIIEKTLASIAE